MRISAILLALFLVAVALASYAHAGPRVMGVDPGTAGALPNALPADSGEPPSTLVNAARRLPAAVLAMQQLEAAGYTRAPEADAAKVNAGRACVTLAFLDPEHPSHAPLVIVMSDPTSVPTRTWVASAVFDVDVTTGAVQLAFDSPEIANCIVTTTDMSSTRPGNYTVTTGKLQREIIDWFHCAVLGCGAGGAGCAVVGSVLGPLAPPAIGGCVIAICATASWLCLW